MSERKNIIGEESELTSEKGERVTCRDEDEDGAHGDGSEERID